MDGDRVWVFTTPGCCAIAGIGGPTLNQSAKHSTRDRVEILLEEYRAVYALVSLRLSSLERRAALAAATLAAMLTSFAGIDADGQRALIVGLPLAMLWLVRTTVTHCQGFEDAVRHIELIEGRINGITGETLLSFQMQHPSRQRSGGRTGRESVLAVSLTTLLTLGGCEFLAWRHRLFDPPMDLVYASYVAIFLVAAAYSVFQFFRYRYQRRLEAAIVPH